MTSVQSDWVCPISQALMRNPVIAPDGYTYERDAITTWLTSNPISPLTRVSMTVADLVPNRALQATIEIFLRDNPDPELPRPIAPRARFQSAPVTVSGSKFRAADGKLYLHVRAAAPAHGTRQPVVLLPIIDNSGSMGESVGAAGGIEDMGFTRLDLVKHAVRTMAAILGPEDIMGIVSFSTEGKVVLNPMRMDAAGKSAVNAALDTIHPDASTNIFDGIKKAGMLLADPAYADHNIVAMLLTDGYPTINPPRGIVPSLGSIRRPERWTLHAFGFGYQLDSALCVDLAKWGGGLFGFIPDATMVGTVFINTLAHVLSTANLDTTFRFTDGSTETAVTVGPITYGQPRDYLFEVEGTPLLNGVEVPEGEQGYLYAYHQYKLAIQRAIAQCKSGAADYARTILNEFYDRYSLTENATVKELLKDLRSTKEGEGQVGMAPTYFNRWGEHYMRAYLRAQELQQCMNFKDPGLQIYGGELFHSLQDEGDRVFCDLPPPKPSRMQHTYGQVSAVPISMSIFHNASGGCFAPETNIRLPGGAYKTIAELRRGDTVWTPTGPATVRALVVCGSYNRAQPMTSLGSLVITPFHPVRKNGITAEPWQFPADIAGYTDRLISTVYNLVLDRGHIVLADGWEAITLGHGFTEPVAAHPYFGTRRVVEDLMKQPGWDEGRPTYKNLKAEKDPQTGMICGWVDDI